MICTNCGRQALAAFRFCTDSLLHQGYAHSDLAEVLEAAGRGDAAVAELRQALECCDRKQIIPLARRTRERLAVLESTL